MLKKNDRTKEYGLRKSATLGFSAKRKKHMILFCSIFFVAGLVFSMAATQDIAKNFGYSEALGKSLVIVKGKPWYGPWKWAFWYAPLSERHPAVIGSIIRKNVALVGVFLALSLLVLVYFIRQTGDIRSDLHGTAKIATFKDIRGMGILDQKGAAIGSFLHKKNQHYLYHDGPEHIMIFAPTRSGKGVGLVIPTLLSWPHSMVVYDLKKENWSASAQWRKTHAGNHVLRFEPAAADGSSVRFNPIEEIDLFTENDVSQAQNIATMIIDDTGKGMDDYWSQSGFDFLTGLILHVAYKARQENTTASLPDIAYAISDPDRDTEGLLGEMLDYKHKDGKLHPAVGQAARTMMNKADREQSGVLGTVVSKMNLYRDPIVSRNIATSDFRISDLMNADRPVSLYICVGATDKDRLRPLTRLLFSMILRGLTPEIVFEGGKAKESYKHRCLILFDEFPSVGKLDIFQESLAYLAGYGIKCYLIVQDLAQLRAAYTKDESVMSNCHVRIAYAPNKMDTAEELSRMTGTTTVVSKKISTSRSGKGVSQSTSFQEQKRPLMTPDEVMRIKGIHSVRGEVMPGDMLIFIAGEPVIYGTQILYFKDEAFLRRAQLGAPKSSDRIPRSSTNVAPGHRAAYTEKEDSEKSWEKIFVKPFREYSFLFEVRKRHGEQFSKILAEHARALESFEKSRLKRAAKEENVEPHVDMGQKCI